MTVLLFWAFVFCPGGADATPVPDFDDGPDIAIPKMNYRSFQEPRCSFDFDDDGTTKIKWCGKNRQFTNFCRDIPAGVGWFDYSYCGLAPVNVYCFKSESEYRAPLNACYPFAKMCRTAAGTRQKASQCVAVKFDPYRHAFDCQNNHSRCSWPTK